MSDVLTQQQSMEGTSSILEGPITSKEHLLVQPEYGKVFVQNRVSKWHLLYCF